MFCRISSLEHVIKLLSSVLFMRNSTKVQVISGDVLSESCNLAVLMKNNSHWSRSWQQREKNIFVIEESGSVARLYISFIGIDVHLVHFLANIDCFCCCCCCHCCSYSSVIFIKKSPNSNKANPALFLLKIFCQISKTQ